MSVSAKRHAQAVFQIAREKNEVDKWRADLDTIVKTVSDPSLQAILTSPKVPLAEKEKLLGRVLPGMSKAALNFVCLLVARRRLKILDEVVDYYGRMVDDFKNLEHAEVVSAVPLDKREQELVAERLAAIEGKKVIVTNKVDPAIIGGFVARIEDKLIDGSVKSKLEALKQKLETRT